MKKNNTKREPRPDKQALQARRITLDYAIHSAELDLERMILRAEKRCYSKEEFESAAVLISIQKQSIGGMRAERTEIELTLSILARTRPGANYRPPAPISDAQRDEAVKELETELQVRAEINAWPTGDSIPDETDEMLQKRLDKLKISK